MLSLHETALNGKGFLIIIELSSSPSYIFNFAHLLDTPFMIDDFSILGSGSQEVFGMCQAVWNSRTVA